MSKDLAKTATSLGDLGEFQPDNGAHQYLAGLTSRKSLRTALSSLKSFLKVQGHHDVNSYPWDTLSADKLKLFTQEQLEKDLQPATINTRLSILKKIAKENLLLGHLEIKDYERIRAVKRIKQIRTEPNGRFIEDEEFVQIAKDIRKTEAENPASAARDLALLALSRYGGLRRSEIVSLNMDDCIWENCKLRVRGKGRRDRSQPLPSYVMDFVSDWIDQRGEWDGPLFVRIRRHSSLSHDRLTDQGVYYVITQMQKRLGLRHLTPHDLRRTYCTALLDDGADLSLVSDLMGHADLSTTKIYDRRKDSAKAEVVNQQKNLLGK
jgi:site-specific recombinase XerD